MTLRQLGRTDTLDIEKTQGCIILLVGKKQRTNELELKIPGDSQQYTGPPSYINILKCSGPREATLHQKMSNRKKKKKAVKSMLR